MGVTSQEASMLAKKLNVQSVLLSSNEISSLVNYTHSLQMPRVYSVNQYVNIYGPHAKKGEYIFVGDTVIA